MVINNSQIIFHPGNCLNIKKSYPRECRQCLQYCPHDAITEEKDIKADRCTECGICMSVCPSDGFVDRDMDKLKDYLFDSDSIVLNCPQAEPCGYEISCLGMLDKDAWTVLMLLSDVKSVRILTGDCGQCDDRQACAVSVAFFKDVLNKWKGNHQVKIEILPDKGKRESAESSNDFPNSQKDKNISRRSAIIGLREQGREKVKSLLPSIIAEETYNIPRTRQWLADALKIFPEKKIPFDALKADDKCTNCGVCTKVCPQDALQLVQKEGKIRLIYQAAKCVHCRRCVDICGPQALRFEPIPLSYKLLTGKILLREAVPRYCSKCGKQIFHNNEPRLCIACASKDPNLKGILY